MKAIVSLATHAPNYYKALDRLQHSLEGRFDGNFIKLRGEESVSAPDHNINNYAFKIFAIAYARAKGNSKVFWLDSSNYAVKNVQPIFDYLDREGIFLEDSGHWVGDWCNDAALDYFKITRDEAMTMHMLSSGFVGLDFNKEISKDFFYRWQESMCAGVFNGSWSDHRHDQTAASIIANQMGLKYSDNCTYFAYVGEPYLPPRETAVFHLQGL